MTAATATLSALSRFLEAHPRLVVLSGAGLGAYWTKARDFSIKAFYAWKLGSEDALSAPDKSGRFWIQAVKYF
jgi:hemolysin activation/secretion protein